MASNRPMENGPRLRIMCMIASLCPMIAMRISTQAKGSKRGLRTVRSMSHAAAA